MTAWENLQGMRPAVDWVEQLWEATDPAAVSCGHGYTRTVQAHVVRGQLGPAAAAELYEKAAASFATAGMIFLQAWALTLAAKYAATDRPQDAAALLERARELARQCGATGMYEAAEKQHRRLVRRVSPGAGRAENSSLLATLTEREREIAGIAGTGKKTREIAEELYLSPRTVDVHLTRIYRKLNVQSRAALARLMAEVG
jgi:DNA-binding CsgD family transcriptional regulator